MHFFPYGFCGRRCILMCLKSCPLRTLPVDLTAARFRWWLIHLPLNLSLNETRQWVWPAGGSSHSSVYFRETNCQRVAHSELHSRGDLPSDRAHPQCFTVTLLAAASAICFRALKPGSSALAARHNETAVEASVAMLQHDDICTLPSKLLRCLFYWKMRHKLAVTRKPIYFGFPVSLTCHGMTSK